MIIQNRIFVYPQNYNDYTVVDILPDYTYNFHMGYLQSKLEELANSTKKDHNLRDQLAIDAFTIGGLVGGHKIGDTLYTDAIGGVLPKKIHRTKTMADALNKYADELQAGKSEFRSILSGLLAGKKSSWKRMSGKVRALSILSPLLTIGGAIGGHKLGEHLVSDEPQVVHVPVPVPTPVPATPVPAAATAPVNPFAGI